VVYDIVLPTLMVETIFHLGYWRPYPNSRPRIMGIAVVFDLVLEGYIPTWALAALICPDMP
jgi:hypothetical protein